MTLGQAAKAALHLGLTRRLGSKPGRGTMHWPRLLPVTIAAMAVLLVMKSGSLVWAATGAGSGAVSGGASGTVPSGGNAPPAEKPRDASPPDRQDGADAAGRTPATAVPAVPGMADQPAAGPDGAGQNIPRPGGPGAPAGVSDPGAPPVSGAERALLLDLRHRRAVLEAQGRELDQRNAVLSAAEAKLTSRVEQLGTLQARLEQLEADRRAHDDANWTGLVHVYETMKPRDAAAIFDALDMQVLLAVLDRMQPRRAAPVLAAMQPDRARLATQMLAELRTRGVTPAGSGFGAMPGGLAAPEIVGGGVGAPAAPKRAGSAGG